MLVEYGTTIEAASITLGATITLTIIKICKLKTILYLHILQLNQLKTVAEVYLKKLTS